MHNEPLSNLSTMSCVDVNIVPRGVHGSGSVGFSNQPINQPDPIRFENLQPMPIESPCYIDWISESSWKLKPVGFEGWLIKDVGGGDMVKINKIWQRSSVTDIDDSSDLWLWWLLLQGRGDMVEKDGPAKEGESIDWAIRVERAETDIWPNQVAFENIKSNSNQLMR